MAVKVIIRRKVRPGKMMEVLGIISQLRARAMGQPGHITGETLIGYDDPRTVLVIGTWQNVEAWRVWHACEDRKVLEEKAAASLEESTSHEIFSFGIVASS